MNFINNVFNNSIHNKLNEFQFLVDDKKMPMSWSNLYIKMIAKFRNNKHLRQSLVLYLAMAAGVFLSFGVSILNTRLLSIEDFGKLKFIQQFFLFVATLSMIGYAYSAGRLVARAQKDEVRRLVGCTTVIYILISSFSMVGVIVFSYAVDDFFNVQIGHYVRLVCPLIFVSLFLLVLENLLQGLNNIYQLAVLRILPSALYLCVALCVTAYFNNFSLATALVVFCVTSAVVVLVLLCNLNPKFEDFSCNISEILKENKTNGFPVYMGSLAGVAAAQAISLILGFYTDMQSVGYFTLALVIAMPLQFLPSVVGTTKFKSFANQNHISKKIIVFIVSSSICTLILFNFIIEDLIVFAYTENFRPVVAFVKILSIGMVLHGIGDFFNRFLGSHGKGKELRNAAVMTGVVIFVGCLSIVPFYGAIGAVWVRFISSAAYCSITFRYYSKYVVATSNE